MKKIRAIIVNYNTAKEVVACIDSLLNQRGVNLDVVVVDNASTDNSLDVLRTYEEKITLIASPKNLGFAKANNLVFEQSQSDYTFLLNPDARLTDELALQQLIDSIDSNKAIGLLTPKILDESGKHETLPRYTYPGQKYTQRDFSQLRGDIAWVVGACMLMPSHVYQEVGGFDEGFFLYGEDADLCLRIRQVGYCIEQLSEVLVVHIGGASEKQAPSYDKTMRKQKALHHFYQQHYSKQEALRLVLKEMRRARGRMLLRRRKNPRYHHYQAIYDSSKQYLEEMSV